MASLQRVLGQMGVSGAVGGSNDARRTEGAMAEGARGTYGDLSAMADAIRNLRMACESRLTEPGPFDQFVCADMVSDAGDGLQTCVECLETAISR